MTAQSAQDALIHQLGLDAEGEALIRRVIETQEKIVGHQAAIDQMIPQRRTDVLLLHTGHRVSKYRLAQVLGVSQTTIGNITRDDEPHDDRSEAPPVPDR